MRLIGLVSKRLAKLSPDTEMLARIGGIERGNWSRSQLTISAAGDGLRALAAHSIEMLAIKGASRAARGGPASRGRMINDVDIVVRPYDMAHAFDLLVQNGWQPAGSGSVVFHRSHLTQAVGINLVRGRFGNLDLHRTPFHPPYGATDGTPFSDDASIWSRASTASLGYVPILVPSATDAVTIAIAHGALDAHKSSDWLADIVAAIDTGVDWELLEALFNSRRLHAPAAVALGYVKERLERPVPQSLLARLGSAAAARPLALLATLSETRPKATSVGISLIVRALAKQRRLLRARSSAGRPPIVLPFAFAKHGDRSDPAGPFVLSHELFLADRLRGQSWTGTVDLTLSVELPAQSRRIDLEVNSQDRHLARLRTIVLNRGRRQKVLRFKVPLSIEPHDGSIVLTAAPSRRFNDGVQQALADQYGPTPFRLIHLASRRTRKE
ncbi:MAG: nucleotidyltransferase family protein [Hyphomicrobiales bacterium]|nr:nucleotidyltransferase family protein [Hyphomicrobiales bacterium]